MPSLLDRHVRSELLKRAQQLTPDRVPQWGRMTCPQMLAHVNDVLRMALGDLPTKFQGSPFRFPGMSYMAIYWLPWAKGLPSAPELFRSDGIDWNEEQQFLGELMERIAERDPASVMPVHPLFGSISHKTWAVLAYRHTAHHLRQFGV